MSPPIKLYDNPWVSLYEHDGYVFSHETRCCGTIVAVLLTRNLPDRGREFGIRSETTPCWGSSPELSALTGGMERGFTPKELAVKEVHEESGYKIKTDDLRSLGYCRSSKSSDTVNLLYYVDIDDANPTYDLAAFEAGDGSDLDAAGKIVWHTASFIAANCPCPLALTMLLRYTEWFSE